MSLILYPNYEFPMPLMNNDTFDIFPQEVTSSLFNFSKYQDFGRLMQISNVSSVNNVPDLPWRSNTVNIASEWVYPINLNDTFISGKNRLEYSTRLLNTPSQQICGYTSPFLCDTKHPKDPKIWRPFSPSPTQHENCGSPENICEIGSKKRYGTGNRITIPSITPSKVKIRASKTSVFKAVKKKSYYCTQCSSRYLSNAQLTSHMRVHTGSKPYLCEYPNCSKTFARNEELTRHRRIHSGYKPHLCTVCNKRFGRKDHLSKHLKTHLQVSEKKVHICCVPGCGHRYTRSDALTRHKMTAHSMKKSPKQIIT